METTAYLKVDFSQRILPRQLGSFHWALSDYLGWSGKASFRIPVWAPGQPVSLRDVSLPVLQTHINGSGATVKPSLLCFGPRAAWVAKRIAAGGQVRVMHWGKSYSMEVSQLSLLDFSPERAACPARYSLKAYLPFSPSEDTYLGAISHLYEKRTLVAQRMGENIRQWLQLIANVGPEPIELRNLKYSSEGTFILGRCSLPIFDLEFDCSHKLPLGLGLGYRSELGLGRLSRL